MHVEVSSVHLLLLKKQVFIVDALLFISNENNAR